MIMWTEIYFPTDCFRKFCSWWICRPGFFLRFWEIESLRNEKRSRHIGFTADLVLVRAEMTPQFDLSPLSIMALSWQHISCGFYELVNQKRRVKDNWLISVWRWCRAGGTPPFNLLLPPFLELKIEPLVQILSGLALVCQTRCGSAKMYYTSKSSCQNRLRSQLTSCSA